LENRVLLLKTPAGIPVDLSLSALPFEESYRFEVTLPTYRYRYRDRYQFSNDIKLKALGIAETR